MVLLSASRPRPPTRPRPSRFGGAPDWGARGRKFKRCVEATGEIDGIDGIDGIEAIVWAPTGPSTSDTIIARSPARSRERAQADAAAELSEATLQRRQAHARLHLAVARAVDTQPPTRSIRGISGLSPQTIRRWITPEPESQ
ncbi:hypothetical protein ABZV14_40945 [Streptosporangium canum]|uniref:hypothetical protein n=1 Tax=Streptosporangium canum TaxID=324952 RepID=UPI0033BFA731